MKILTQQQRDKFWADAKDLMEKRIALLKSKIEQDKRNKNASNFLKKHPKKK